jgi:hypothetical protein
MSLSNTKKNETAEPKKGPAEKIRIGMTTITIWENKDDKGNLYPNATFEIRYKDKDGKFQTGSSYGLYDLLSHRAALDEAISCIVKSQHKA